MALPSHTLLAGDVVGERFRIESLLGTGAMAAVYRAVHIKLGRAFAVKVMHPALAQIDKMRERFDREAQLAARLQHTNLAAVVDVGVTEHGYHYLVMELAEGPTLAQLIGGKPMAPARVTAFVKQICDGLAHAHGVGVTHRDLKPENIVIEHVETDRELVRIVDFGIAFDSTVAPRASGLAKGAGETPRITTTGLVCGTPAYMAPEQASGAEIDARVDLYSLGVTMFEMLTGKVPFEGDGMAVARANIEDPAPAMEHHTLFLDVDPLLEAFTKALMEKSREIRIQSAEQARALLELLDHDRTAAAAALGVALPRRNARRTAMPPFKM